MPVFEQGYRRYEGPVHRTSRALAIAWESIRPRMRWWVWLLLFFSMFWPYIVFAAVTFFALMTDQPLDISRIKLSNVVFERFGQPDPARLLAILKNESGILFWEVLHNSMLVGWPLYLTAIAASGILAADRRTNALQIYFARPVSRRDYFAGKLLATAFFTSLVTLLPTLLLWIETAALSTDRMYILRSAWMPLSVIAASSIYALWCAAIVMFWSVILSRPAVVALAAVFSFLFLHGLGGLLAGAADMKAGLVASPAYAIGGATAPLFGLTTPEWLPWLHCFAAAVLFPAALLWFVGWRIRAVEVVT